MATERLRPGTPRFVQLLAATTVGVYLLLVAGTTTALTDASMACQTWPLCDGRLFVPLDDPRLAIVWSHRALAAVVGLMVALTAVSAWRTGEPRRVRRALAASLALYPVQIGMGAFVVGTGTPALLSAVHLVTGTAIFAGLVLALAWTLERRYTGANEGRPDGDWSPDPEGPTASDPEPLGPMTLRETLSGYFRLMKPRLMWLLCLVASAGMALAAGPDLEVGTVVATLLGGVLSIGASGTYNHVLERDVDRKMKRTADRPVAKDRIPIRNALAFAVLLTVASIAVFLTINAVAAVLGAFAILFYSVVYTLILKPNTVQNTVIGGLAGALPALIGWAAVTGDVGLPALGLAGVIFLWTPAHFYNLALAYKDDYAAGGFPMLPVVRGDVVTRKHILWYLGATLVGATVLGAVDGLDWLYAATCVVFGGVFLLAVVGLHRERTRAATFRSFHASNAYLGALLLAVIADALVV